VPHLESSVVIPCYNAAATLGEQLEALATQESAGPFEVIVVDNGSRDGSGELASGYADRFTRFTLVAALERQGAGYARNVGVATAQAPKILFCDADDVVSPHWVGAMTEALDRHALVGGGRDFHRLNADWHPVSSKHPDSTDPRDICDVHFIGEGNIPNVGAGNLGIRRSVLLELGGFAPDLPIHEDVDLCLRAFWAGHPLGLCPEAMVSIRVRQSLGSVFHQARIWGYWSVALLKKHRARLRRPLFWHPILGWPILFFRAVGIKSRRDLTAWVYRLGWKCGRLHGSIVMAFLAL
jgi:glycosyltransferase involved in cell wall biosynthesis